MLIVSVGVCFDLPRDGDMAMLTYLAARVDNETLLTKCAYYRVSMGADGQFGVSVQPLIDRSTHPYCACQYSKSLSVFY